MWKKKISKGAVAYMALVAVVLIWSLAPIVANLKIIEYNYSPGMLIAMRTLFALLALAVINGKKLKEVNKEYLKVAIPSGCFLATATLCQMIGYRYGAAPGESAVFNIIYDNLSKSNNFLELFSMFLTIRKKLSKTTKVKNSQIVFCVKYRKRIY